MGSGRTVATKPPSIEGPLWGEGLQLPQLCWAFVGKALPLSHGYGQDRFVRGVVTLDGFGFTGLVSEGSLKTPAQVTLTLKHVRVNH